MLFVHLQSDGTAKPLFQQGRSPGRATMHAPFSRWWLGDPRNTPHGTISRHATHCNHLHKTIARYQMSVIYPTSFQRGHDANASGKNTLNKDRIVFKAYLSNSEGMQTKWHSVSALTDTKILLWQPLHVPNQGLLCLDLPWSAAKLLVIDLIRSCSSMIGELSQTRSLSGRNCGPDVAFPHVPPM